MSCQKVRKYLFAFADSQLSVQSNCEVLDHLKMCSACSTIVDQHQAVRQALVSSAEKIESVPGLEQRVRLAIQTGKLVRHRAPRRSLLNDSGFLRVVALAACITLVVLLAWQFAYESEPGSWGEDGPRLAFSSSAAETTQFVVKRHNQCDALCERGEHQDAGLPNSLDGLATALSSEYDGKLAALAPDLSEYGFTFDSANFCRLENDEGPIAAHVVYVNTSYGTRFSIFSLPQWDRINDSEDGVEPTIENPFIQTHDQCSQMTVLGWHARDMSFVCCGSVGAGILRSMAQDIGVAMGEPGRYETLADAFSALGQP
jgi:hypothetical protein